VGKLREEDAEMKKTTPYLCGTGIGFLSLLILLISAIPAFAATYYVKNSSCSDNNNGSESSPWCHCPRLAGWSGRATLGPGDIVHFDRGGTWTASSGNYVLDVKGGVSYIGDTWGTGTRAKLQALSSLAHCVVRFYDDDSSYATVVKGFEVDANHTITTGIGINHPSWTPANCPLTGATKRIQNCIVHDTYSETARGEYKYGIIVSSWGRDGSTIVENVEILDNIVYNQSRTAINLYPSWNTDADRIGKILVRGNETYATAQDPGYDAGCGLAIKDNVYDVIAEFNTFHGDNGSTGTALLVNHDRDNGAGPSNITIRYNILENTSGDNFHIRQYGSKDIDFYGNIVMNAGSGQGLKVDGSTTDSLKLKLFNNVFYNNIVLIEGNSASNTIAFKNNIVYVSGMVPLSDTSGYVGGNHANNTYYRTDGGTLVHSRGSSYSAANIASYEATGLSSNPLFVNTSNRPTGFVGTYGVDRRPNTDGLSLQSDSPAKDSGADLGSSYHNSINSVTRPYGAGWDRGAYEVGSNDAVAPSPPANFRIASSQMVPTAEITLAWDANPESDVAGYKVYYGTASRKYTHSVDVGNVTQTTLPVSKKKYCIALTAYDTNGNESGFSNEVSWPIQISQPNGSEILHPLDSAWIEWSAPSEAVSFTLSYSLNNGETWRTIEENVTGSSYNWPVPTPPGNKRKCLVKVVGYD
jgi:hypothetical protein